MPPLAGSETVTCHASTGAARVFSCRPHRPRAGSGARGDAGARARARRQPDLARPEGLRGGLFRFPMTTKTTINTDLLTPLGAYLRLRDAGSASFILESVERGRLGR